MKLGALEAGGTKMVLAVGNEKGNIQNRISIPTRTPEETMPEMIKFFKENDVDALGIGCFGPIDLDRQSQTYGYITSTPKLAWKNYNIVGEFKKALQKGSVSFPVGFDTDVNGSALGEWTFGCMQGLHTGMYITIGTGIGAGVFAEGKLLHGMLHPECGHILLSKHPSDTYEGKCPYHRNCFEGLAAGPAIEERYGQKAALLAERNDVWDLEAYYIAQALVSYILTLSPQRIVLGGGVMHQEQLFPLIRKKVKELLNGYIVTKELLDIDSYIVPASLNDDQGILGALKLAADAVKKEPHSVNDVIKMC